MSRRFLLDWHAGPTAQLELFSSDDEASDEFHIRYIPPFRATLRVPLERQPLALQDLQPIQGVLDAYASPGLQDRGAMGNGVPDAAGDAAWMRRAGGQLFQFTVPRHVQAEFRTRGLFLEIGIDERLVDFPWELMHDGDDYLCNKHSIGRYVNVRNRPIAPQAQRPLKPGAVLDELSVLLISVPRPQPRDALTTYDQLLFAEAEAKAITETVGRMDGVRLSVLSGRDATYNAVWDALQQGVYHIVHYTGHAHFDHQNPRHSALVLHDRDMATEPLASFFGANPPIVCFMNACETGLAPAWKTRYDVYGLAWAFLGTGSYLIGTRWKVDDQIAKKFADEFYTSLLIRGEALGTAVSDARRAAYDKNDPAWASYVLYGDPRVGFTRRKRRLPQFLR